MVTGGSPVFLFRVVVLGALPERRKPNSGSLCADSFFPRSGGRSPHWQDAAFAEAVLKARSHAFQHIEKIRNNDEGFGDGEWVGSGRGSDSGDENSAVKAPIHNRFFTGPHRIPCHRGVGAKDSRCTIGKQTKGNQIHALINSGNE